MASTRLNWIKPAVFLAAAAILGVIGVEVLHWWRHVDEPNARIEADFTLLSSSVNATVATVHVRRGDRVKKGTLLASMKTAVAGLDVATLEAEAARERAARDQVVAELAEYKREIKNKTATSEAAIRLQRRELKAWERRQGIAQSNLDRQKQLASRRAVSERQLDDAADRLLEITSKMHSLETAIQAKLRQLLELRSALEKEAVFKARFQAIERAIDIINVQLRQSQQRLEDMDIRAPIAGIIDEVYVSAGVYVEDGDRAFLMHDPNALWLEARIDESDIHQVAVGQLVNIEFDAYPFEYFSGKVRSIGNATLGSMANGTSNVDLRLAQRIRVLIDLPKIDKPTWPGMQASINIAVR